MNASDRNSTRAQRILVIDDELDMLETLDSILSSAGYEICTANSGAAAIEIAKRGVFDLIITDLRMPGMSGVDTIVALRQIIPSVPVIVVSGFISEESARRCRAEGAIWLVAKPIQLDELLHLVSIALNNLAKPQTFYS